MPAEGLHVGQLGRGSLQLRIGAPQPLGQIPGQRRYRKEPQDIQPDAVQRHSFRRQEVRAGPFRQAGILGHDRQPVEQRGPPEHHHSSPPGTKGARGDDGQRIQGREEAVDPAGQGHEARHDHRIDEQLDVDEPPVPLRVADAYAVDERQRECRAEQREEGLEGQDAWRPELHQHGRPQQHAESRRAGSNQPEELPSHCGRHHVLDQSFEIRSKIGMYIAMTIPPTTTPRKAIITGSISVRSPATAVSTSSS